MMKVDVAGNCIFESAAVWITESFIDFLSFLFSSEKKKGGVIDVVSSAIYK